MPSTEKNLMYDIVKKRMNKKSVFVSGFRGLTVSEVSNFRKNVRASSGDCLVVKRTLAAKYLKEQGVESTDGMFADQVMLTAAGNEIQKISKLLVDFEKDFESKFSVRGAYVEGALRNRNYVVRLSQLPSKEQLVGRLLGTMNAPIRNFVCGLNGVIRSLAVVLNEVKKQKETTQGNEAA